MVNYSDGIHLEDTSAFLIWDTDVNKLAVAHSAEVEVKGDRTIYKWGIHKILNGLALNLTSHYWNIDKKPEERKLTNIEFWAIGDNEATKYEELIYHHLIENFGEAIQEETFNGGDKLRKWEIGNTKITLHFFEMHSYRLCLKLEKYQKVTL